MTNGEKFKEIFPDIQIEDANMEVNVYINHCLVTFPKEWWNKTYTKGGSFCVQKGCSAMTIASCCGCKDYFDWRKKK